MRLGPRPANRPWTPADDAQLLALLNSESGQSFDRPEIKADRVGHRQATEHFEQTPPGRARAEGERKVAIQTGRLRIGITLAGPIGFLGGTGVESCGASGSNGVHSSSV